MSTGRQDLTRCEGYGLGTRLAAKMQARKHQRPPRRVAVFTICYVHAGNPMWGAYTFLALERRPALLPTAEPPGVRRSVTADISVASSHERSSYASLYTCHRTSVLKSLST